MKLHSTYDLVIEMDYPLGKSTTLAYDTWAREIRTRLTARFDGDFDVSGLRVLRQEDHLKICIQVYTMGAVASALGIALGAIYAHSPADFTVWVHELPETPPPTAETMMLEEETA